MAKIGSTVSEQTSYEAPAYEIEQALTNLIGNQITSIERIYGGQNNRLYRLTCSNSMSYVAKFYPSIASTQYGPNERDRLTAEFSSLLFLYERGVDSVPKPIVSDTAFGCAIYQYVEGQKISPSDITKQDVDQAVSFLVNIRNLCKSEGSSQLPAAAEACFSLQGVIQNIDDRLARLQKVPSDGKRYQQLHSFLARDFIPAFTEIRQWSQWTFESWGMSLDQELSLNERTLSPSDFGFHNALRRPNGQIMFLDFEYFGWDDPVKMISDFLIHPAMTLDDCLKNRFVDGILTGFQQNELLRKRLTVLYPLFGLKWCMIILNEFLPEKLARRNFSNGIPSNLDEIQEIQLQKAGRILDWIKENYSHFPHIR